MFFSVGGLFPFWVEYCLYAGGLSLQAGMDSGGYLKLVMYFLLSVALVLEGYIEAQTMSSWGAIVLSSLLKVFLFLGMVGFTGGFGMLYGWLATKGWFKRLMGVYNESWVSHWLNMVVKVIRDPYLGLVVFYVFLTVLVVWDMFSKVSASPGVVFSLLMVAMHLICLYQFVGYSDVGREWLSKFKSKVTTSFYNFADVSIRAFKICVYFFNRFANMYWRERTKKWGEKLSEKEELEGRYPFCVVYMISGKYYIFNPDVDFIFTPEEWARLVVKGKMRMKYEKNYDGCDDVSELPREYAKAYYAELELKQKEQKDNNNKENGENKWDDDKE